jgi:hypothetical protein
MPLPKRPKGQKIIDFIPTCMAELKGEFPDPKQRFAVCRAQAIKRPKK